MNKTESCYEKRDRSCTLYSPSVDGTPIKRPVRLKMASGEEKTITRQEYKRWRKEQKRAR